MHKFSIRSMADPKSALPIQVLCLAVLELSSFSGTSFIGRLELKDPCPSSNGLRI